MRTVLLNPSSADTRQANDGMAAPLPLTSLQLRYAATAGAAAGDKDRAHAEAQARRGSGVLPLADYLMFSADVSAEEVLGRQPTRVPAILRARDA